jgi:hypothetical protein
VPFDKRRQLVLLSMSDCQTIKICSQHTINAVQYLLTTRLASANGSIGYLLIAAYQVKTDMYMLVDADTKDRAVRSLVVVFAS